MRDEYNEDHWGEPETELLLSHRFAAYCLDRAEGKNLIYDVHVNWGCNTICMKVIDDPDGVMEKWLNDFKSESKPFVIDLYDCYGNVVVRKLFRDAQVGSMEQMVNHTSNVPLHFVVVVNYSTYEREKYPRRQA